jgi:hypothetical protein
MDRTKEEGSRFMLDFIQSNLEKSVSNWEVVSTEDLFDEEMDEVIRVFNFNRGIKTYFIVIDPRFGIKATSSKISWSLLIDVHNSLNSVMWKFIRSGSAVPK